jgi:hypothetical protein
VMMPSVPLAHLVLSHPQAVLGFSQSVFDPKARCGTAKKTTPRVGISSCVAKSIVPTATRAH